MDPAHAPSRRPAGRRLAAALAVAGLVPLVAASGAAAGAAGAHTAGTQSAAGTRTASTQSAAGLQAEAAQLATEIQDQGIHLDQLSEQYDAAMIHRSQVDAELRTIGVTLAATDRRVAASRRTLVEQAIASYISGDTPLQVVVSGHAGLDPSLTEAYAAILGGTEHRALVSFESLRRTQTRQEQRLRTQRTAAAAAVARLAGDRRQAEAAQGADQALLSQLTGRLGALVAADQRRQEADQAAAERSVLASEGPLPPASSTTSPTTAPAAHRRSTSPVTAHRTTPTTTRRRTPTSPPTTAPPTTAPRPTSPPPTSPPPTSPPSSGISPQAPGASKVLAYARAQLGKPYQWGGAGPASFDCSGLVMEAWMTAGIDFPHLAQDQYDLTERIPLADLLAGDLVFFGTPSDVYHVGIYIGDGEMIDAPETGQDVSVQSIYWSTLLGGGRVTVGS